MATNLTIDGKLTIAELTITGTNYTVICREGIEAGKNLKRGKQE